jgi:hypothetical protein
MTLAQGNLRGFRVTHLSWLGIMPLLVNELEAWMAGATEK